MNEKKFSWVTSGVYVLAAFALLFAVITYSNTHSYEGTGDGFAGPITVKITLNDGKITDAQLVSNGDSEFSLPTITTILEQAIANGNADNLDVIAGATGSSTGTITALQAAFNTATSISYEKEVYGSPNKITIKVTVSDGKFVGGEIISDSQSALAFPAITTILAQAVKNGNADNLDVVGGATSSSRDTIKTLQEIFATSDAK